MSYSFAVEYNVTWIKSLLDNGTIEYINTNWDYKWAV